jgi:hypothetical protein
MREGYLYLVTNNNMSWHNFKTNELVECIKIDPAVGGGQFKGEFGFWWMCIDEIVEIGKI